MFDKIHDVDHVVHEFVISFVQTHRMFNGDDRVCGFGWQRADPSLRHAALDVLVNHWLG